jgi:hypothetical protein
MSSLALETAYNWQNASNAADIDTLLALSDPNIEIVGPRGSVTGSHILKDWIARANLTLTTQRTFLDDDRVVLQQHGVWRNEDGTVQGETDVATFFRVKDGQVTYLARFDALDDALRAAQLTHHDEQGT